MENNNRIPMTPDYSEIVAEKAKTFLPDDEWMDVDISDDWLDPTDELERAKNAMFIGDAPVCSLGGFTVLTGQSGNGKTMTIAMLISAVFRGKYGQFVLGGEIKAPVVLYVDTEMEKYNTQRLMNRVYFINGWQFKTVHPEFRVMRLRDTVDVGMRWKKVLKAIDEVRPTFCILDGLIDLVRDFNDNVECQQLVYKLMAAASWYDMSVVGVIHQNPGGDKMAGHLGSFGERKAITTLATKKDKNGNEVLFIVEQKKARDKDAEDFKFRVNDDSLHIGIPEPVGIVPDVANDEDEVDYNAFVERIMPREGMSTRDLRLAVEKEYKVGHSKADKIMWTLEDDKYLFRDTNKRYFLNADRPKNNTPF